MPPADQAASWPARARPGRVFRYAKGDRAGRAAAVDYGRTVGVPEHQLDWAD